MLRAILLLLLLLPITTVAEAEAPAAPSAELVKMLQQAQQALDAKEHVRAAGLLEQAHADAPDPEAQWLYLAAASWRLAGRPDDAARVLDALKDALERARADWEPSWLELAVFTALERGNAAEAERMAGRLAAREPGRARSWRLLAKTRLEGGDTAGAATAMETAVRMGDATDDDLRVQADLRALAELYLAAGATSLGAAALERALGPSPSAKDCDRLAMIRARAGDMDAALAWMDKAQGQAPEARRMLDRGDMLRDAGRDAEAIKAYAEAARLAPNSGRAWLLLGYAAYDGGRFDQARQAFARAAALPATRDAASHALAALEAMLRENAAGDEP